MAEKYSVRYYEGMLGGFGREVDDAEAALEKATRAVHLMRARWRQADDMLRDLKAARQEIVTLRGNKEAGDGKT